MGEIQESIGPHEVHSMCLRSILLLEVLGKTHYRSTTNPGSRETTDSCFVAIRPAADAKERETEERNVWDR